MRVWKHIKKKKRGWVLKKEKKKKIKLDIFFETASAKQVSNQAFRI